MVIEKQTGTYHPARPQLRHVGHHEPQWRDQVRRDVEQHFALGERFRHQPEFVLLQITQAAVYQLAAR